MVKYFSFNGIQFSLSLTFGRGVECLNSKICLAGGSSAYKFGRGVLAFKHIWKGVLVFNMFGRGFCHLNS